MVCPCCQGAGVQYVEAYRVELQGGGALEHRGVRVLCPTCKGIGAVAVEVQMQNRIPADVN